MGMVAPGHLAERLPSLDRDLAIGFRRQIQNDFGGIDIGVDARPALGRPAVIDPVVQLTKTANLALGVPAYSLAAIAEPVGERAECSEAAVGVGVIPFDDSDLRRRDTRHEVALAVLPVPDLEGLGELGGGVVLDRRQYDIA